MVLLIFFMYLIIVFKMNNAIHIFSDAIILTMLTSLIPMLIAKTKKMKIIAVEVSSIFVIPLFFIYSKTFYVNPEKYKIGEEKNKVILKMKDFDNQIIEYDKNKYKKPIVLVKMMDCVYAYDIIDYDKIDDHIINKLNKEKKFECNNIYEQLIKRHNKQAD